MPQQVNQIIKKKTNWTLYGVGGSENKKICKVNWGDISMTSTASPVNF